MPCVIQPLRNLPCRQTPIPNQATGVASILLPKFGARYQSNPVPDFVR